MNEIQERHPLGTTYRIDHDGFIGEVIGYYRRIDGKTGVVLQQLGTSVVHVYGEKWLTNRLESPTPLASPAQAGALPPMPATQDRQAYDEETYPDYVEGNRDWAEANNDAIEWLADNHKAIRAVLASNPVNAKQTKPDGEVEKLRAIIEQEITLAETPVGYGGFNSEDSYEIYAPGALERAQRLRAALRIGQAV